MDKKKLKWIFKFYSKKAFIFVKEKLISFVDKKTDYIIPENLTCE